MSGPWDFWSADQIAAATSSPRDAILETWPLLYAALDQRGVSDKPVLIAALATVAVESSSFRPVREAFWLSGAARNAYLTKMYEGREDLGNILPGDGVKYAGAGLIQITGRGNYRTYGNAISVDLESNPDLALDPSISCQIFAAYFTRHFIRWLPAPMPLMSCVDLARAEEWRGVRVAVNGGENGLDLFLSVVAKLGAPSMPVTYNASEPAIAQNDPWSCAPTSTRWAMTALGRHPSESWMESQMLADGIVSKEEGLLVASGGPLAAWITAQYGEFGYAASNDPSVSFDDVVAEAGKYPLLLGGRAWGHWSGVRGLSASTDTLMLANPADGWMGVGQTMNRQQFAALGPFSMVRVTHPDLAPVPPDPPAPADPRDAEMAALRAENARLRDVIGYASQDISRAIDKETSSIRASLGALDAATSTLKGQS